jgi:hypothetical protein
VAGAHRALATTDPVVASVAGEAISGGVTGRIRVEDVLDASVSKVILDGEPEHPARARKTAATRAT